MKFAVKEPTFHRLSFIFFDFSRPRQDAAQVEVPNPSKTGQNFWSLSLGQAVPNRNEL